MKIESDVTIKKSSVNAFFENIKKNVKRIESEFKFKFKLWN